MSKKRFKTWDDLESYMLEKRVHNDKNIMKYCPEYIIKMLNFGGGGAGLAVAFDEELGWMILWGGMGCSGIDYIDKGYNFIKQFIEEKSKASKDKYQKPMEVENEHLKQNITRLSKNLHTLEGVIDMWSSDNISKEKKEMIKTYFKTEIDKLESSADYYIHGTKSKYYMGDQYQKYLPYIIAKNYFKSNMEILDSGKDFLSLKENDNTYFISKQDDKISIKYVSLKDGSTEIDII